MENKITIHKCAPHIVKLDEILNLHFHQQTQQWQIEFEKEAGHALLCIRYTL